MEELRDVIEFVDAREAAIRLSEPERLQAFSAMFISALEMMSEEERLQIVEFATGSMVRPDKLIIHLVDVSTDKGTVDEITAHACINSASSVELRCSVLTM